MNEIATQKQTDSEFLRRKISERLHELRIAVAIPRHVIREWRQGWVEPTRYWQARKFECIGRLRAEIKNAERELRDFIADHRSIMGPEWIGNDHGRLCWDSFLGGLPIDQHYCQLEEGHDGFCSGETFAWPKGVRNEFTWRRIREDCDHQVLIQYCGITVCSRCGTDPNSPPTKG